MDNQIFITKEADEVCRSKVHTIEYDTKADFNSFQKIKLNQEYESKNPRCCRII